MFMDQEGIKAIIPHRDPFLYVDSVETLTYDTVVAYKKVTGEEDFFHGHFPGYPVMPGVIIIEALAQAGAICLLSRPEFIGKLGFFAGIDKARFKRKVFPGDTLRLDVLIHKMRGNIGFATCKAYVGEELAASAEVICAIGG